MMDDTPELHRNPEAAAEMAANAVTRYLRESGITDPVARDSWIAKVFEAVRAREGRAN
jgi:hypothetical protein